MRTVIYSIILLISGALPRQAFADFSCNVSVKSILVYGDGTVNLLHSGRGDYTVICNMDADYRGVSPSTCAMWVGILEAIKKNSGTAAFYYPGTGSCSALPTYGNAPVPTYVGDVSP